MSWLTGYTTRRRITINRANVGENLTNFPVLVRLTAANFTFANTTATGFDIRFTLSDGTTLLDYERERHDRPGSRAEYWVRVPTVLGTGTVDTFIFIYFRDDMTIPDGANPTAVWDVNFREVWHMRDATPSTIVGSRNSLTGTKGATGQPNEAEGRIAGGQNFGAITQTITVPDNPLLEPGDDITVEAWVFLNVALPDGSQRGLIHKRENPVLSSAWNFYFRFVTTESPNLRFIIDGATTAGGWGGRGGGNVPVGSWVYLAGVHRMSALSPRALYQNGVEVATVDWGVATGTRVDNTEPVTIGKAGTWMDGVLAIFDEIRLSNTIRSPAWIRASFHSGNDTLLIYGAEERPITGASLLMAMANI